MYLKAMPIGSAGIMAVTPGMEKALSNATPSYAFELFKNNIKQGQGTLELLKDNKIKIKNYTSNQSYWTLNGLTYSQDPTYQASTSYNYIHDQASWLNAVDNGPLGAYYATYPDEDRWVFESMEKLLNNDPSGGHYGRAASSADKPNGEWLETAIQCWWGALGAAGAKFPWVCPVFTDDVLSKIIYRYEGKDDVRPWGDNLFGIGVKQDGTNRMWGIASVAEEFQDRGFLLPENVQGEPANSGWTGTAGANNFDITKFSMILEKQGVNFIEIEDASNLVGETLVINGENLYTENNTNTGFKINIQQ